MVIYTNVRGLNVWEHVIECIPFTIISIDYLLLHLENYACEIVNREMLDYLDDNFFETDQFL